MTKRRTDDDRINELMSKIEGIKQRAERRKLRANPAVKHGTAAVKAIDKAARETSDGAARKALEDARGAVSAWLALEGLAVAQGASEAPVKRGRRKAVATA